MHEYGYCPRVTGTAINVDVTCERGGREREIYCCENGPRTSKRVYFPGKLLHAEPVYCWTTLVMFAVTNYANCPCRVHGEWMQIVNAHRTCVIYNPLWRKCHSELDSELDYFSFGALQPNRPDLWNCAHPKLQLIVYQNVSTHRIIQVSIVIKLGVILPVQWMYGKQYVVLFRQETVSFDCLGLYRLVKDACGI